MGDVLGSILLLEDEAGVRVTLEKMLTRKGYKVESFASAEEAIERLDRGNHVSLAIVDVLLPGMNGVAFSDWIELHHSGIPVLFMTGDTHSVTKPGYITIGKPVNREEFLSHVWQHLKIGVQNTKFREIKQDFGTCITKIDSLAKSVLVLSEKFDTSTKSNDEARSNQDDRLMTLSSRVEVTQREVTNARNVADNAHSKIDNITVPNLVRTWRSNWDPVLTMVISALFTIVCSFLAVYKDAIIDAVGKRVSDHVAQTSRQEVAVLKAEVTTRVDDIEARQVSVEKGQHSLGKNIDKVMDKLGIEKEGRAPAPPVPSPLATHSPVPSPSPH